MASIDGTLWLCRLFLVGKNHNRTMKKIIRVALSFTTFPNDQLNSFLIRLVAAGQAGRHKWTARPPGLASRAEPVTAPLAPPAQAIRFMPAAF
jgi:hypothetical protein